MVLIHFGASEIDEKESAFDSVRGWRLAVALARGVKSEMMNRESEEDKEGVKRRQRVRSLRCKRRTNKKVRRRTSITRANFAYLKYYSELETGQYDLEEFTWLPNDYVDDFGPPTRYRGVSIEGRWLSFRY